MTRVFRVRINRLVVRGSRVERMPAGQLERLVADAVGRRLARSVDAAPAVASAVASKVERAARGGASRRG